ncbi:MAG: TolC family protein, partial [Fibrobacterota bacterium]
QAAQVKVDELVVSRGLQLWEDVELRYQANRSDLRKQELGLRLSPSGWGERSANRELNKARRAVGDAHIRQKTSNAILDRYKQALDWLFQSRQRKYHLEKKQLCDRRIEVMSKLASLPTFDPKDLVEAQVERIQHISKIEGDQYSLARIEQRMRQFVPGSGDIALEGELLSAAEIEATLSRLDGSVADSFPEIGVAVSQLEMERAKTSAEIGSSRRWISYLEAGYTFDVDENRKERATQRDNIAFGFGVKIPLFDGSTQEIGRRKADLAEVRLKYQDDREDIIRNLERLRLSIGSMLRQIVVLDSFSMRVDAGKLFSEFAMRSGSDPLLVLRARETSIETTWKMEEIRFLLLREYLEILHLTGAIV